MHCLIIGGCGFIGYNLASDLLEKGNSVTVLDNLSRKGTTYNLQNLYNHPNATQFNFRQADIRLDQTTLEEEVAKADLIFHLAAQVAVTTSVTDPTLDFQINLLGTFNILEALRKQSSKAVLLYASTNKVYGGMEEVTIKKGPDHYYYKDKPFGISEEQNLDFHSPYGCSKGGAEQYIRDYKRIYGLRTICFRQSCIYGPYQFGIEDQGWIAWFTIAAIYNKPITIYGDGMQVRDVLHVKDLIGAYNASVEHIENTNGQIYNVGGSSTHQLSLLKLVSILEQKLNKKIPFSFDKWRPGDQPVYISDISKITKDTNWKPQIAIDQGLDALIEWATANKTVLKQVGII